MIRFITFCVISLAGVLISHVHSSDDCKNVKCPPIPKHYEEFNCVPMKEKSEDCCPTHFDCSFLKSRDRTKCHYGNETYEPRQELDNKMIESTCTAACRCLDSDENESAKFVCAHIDCPEFFGHHPEEKQGQKCIRQHEFNSCCITNSVCGEQITKLATCDFGGRRYYEGERMETESSCYSCICGKDFEDKPVEMNKHCQKINCNMDLHYHSKIEDGCIPVYLENDNCCPIMWRCPDEETVIVPSNNSKKIVDSPQKCTFGNLTMNVGDILSPENEYDTCTLCECRLPPMAHCIQTC